MSDDEMDFSDSEESVASPYSSFYYNYRPRSPVHQVQMPRIMEYDIKFVEGSGTKGKTM